ncbi:hypothetical protein MTo_00579 [Microcystis aeruginosa NIES-1211]|jgi:hypothetical protein|uniref:DUF4231 domain-containing protein n=1 Tax=Microcystis aeruginosa NIES-2519 TaxID=2303981 RepID=A0A5A5RG18_MICAE|nr:MULTISPECIES: DUF4231 domain-containing protein [Microcystis]AVQ71040.1 hypothetical protein B5D77_06625 [Microcystis sp. MC19]CCI31864.1 conserved hypothetical protein [Microcystis sp. T1-4]GBL13289.1 hypothetical protein MTo_00579 [Microcystis aeruginosa NIES-1211]GCA72117.1 hypothetical protein MiYa_03664 [Microcystis aeruginosa NIES-2519]GCA84435.1 hypothetical protein MiHa_02406 [Microcystis aeruginosa NIES-2522]
MPDSTLELKSLEKTSEPKKSQSYRNQFQQEICGLIEQIDLPDLQKQFMKARWLEQLLWLEGRAQTSRNQYYFLRLITIIGGVIVPALVSLNINANDVQVLVGWLAFGLSQVVAISAAVEEFFHYGERYRHYRNTAEAMKIEGWQFFQLSGSYRHAQNHAEVYPDFAQRVESIIQRDVEGYLSEVVKEKEKPKQPTEIAKTPLQ